MTEKYNTSVSTEEVDRNTILFAAHEQDDKLLAELGYRAEFKREFSVRFVHKFDRGDIRNCSILISFL